MVGTPYVNKQILPGYFTLKLYKKINAFFQELTCIKAFNGPAFHLLLYCKYLDSFQKFKEHLLGLSEQATLITSKMISWRKAVLFPVFQLERVTSSNNNVTVFFWRSVEWNKGHILEEITLSYGCLHCCLRRICMGKSSSEIQGQ